MPMQSTARILLSSWGDGFATRLRQGNGALASGRRAWVPEAYGNIADAYYNGEGVERDMKKAKHYYELAAMGGNVDARHNLGCIGGHAGNMSRAVKHWMIAAGAGYDDSLKEIRDAL